MDDLRALSVRQPWAHAIVHLGKDLENRGRRYAHRGPTLIHASGNMTLDEYAAAGELMRVRGLTDDLPKPGHLPRGGIVGIVDVVDCVSAADLRSNSPWWIGPYGLLIANARPLPFIECRGSVCPLFWRPDAAVLARVREALA